MISNFQIVGEFSKDKFAQFSPAETENMIIISNRNGKEDGLSLQPAPGYRFRQLLPIGTVVRELFDFQDLYAVCSDRIYSLDSNLTPTDITSFTQLNTSSGHVGIAANQNDEVLFVDGVNGYGYDINLANFQLIADVNFPTAPVDCAFLDGFFIVASGRNIFLSQLNDVFTWTPVRAAQFNTKPDVIVGLETLNRNLYVFGNNATEQYYNAGTAGFTFRRNNTFAIDYGCASRRSIARGHGKLFWLANNEDGIGSVLMTEGGPPERVSTEAIDSEIESLTTVSDSIGFVYKTNNNVFLSDNFPH